MKIKSVKIHLDTDGEYRVKAENHSLDRPVINTTFDGVSLFGQTLELHEGTGRDRPTATLESDGSGDMAARVSSGKYTGGDYDGDVLVIYNANANGGVDATIGIEQL